MTATIAAPIEETIDCRLSQICMESHSQYIVLNSFLEGILRFEWNENEVSAAQRAEIQEFLDRVNELGLENAFFDEEALVYIDGTHVPIPACVRVIRE